MPPAIVEKLRAALRKAATAEIYAEQQAGAGNRIVSTDGPEWREWLMSDYDRWGALIRESGVSVAQ